ncbi:MAG: transposase family protein, partial [Proteobacteria bacterium]|nr:transposase family protein [Pseudomonadota bacterium]
MCADVKYFIRTCKKCQKRKGTKLLKPKLKLKPIPVPSRIFAQVGMDLIHMKPCRGFNYIITAVDYLTKYCEMRALKEKSEKQVAKFIFEDLICRWGCSEYHISDQGREFVNNINRNLLEKCGTQQHITSSFHPQANGLCEHLNRTTQDTLVKNLNKEGDWVEMIPTVAFSHRCSQSATTGYSPLELITGITPRVPVDVQIKYPN